MKSLLSSLIAVLFWANLAYPCDWPDPGFEKQFSNAQLVFLAKLTRVSKTEWNIEVQRVWKGTVPEKGTLSDRLAGTDCEVGFVEGTRYVVFASRPGKTEIFYTSVMSGTKPVDDDLLRKLGMGRPPKSGRADGR